MNARMLEAKARGGRRTAVVGLALLLVALAGGPGAAQDRASSPEAAPQVYLSVTSDPPGVVVRLIGTYEFVGTTPWRLHRPVEGLFRVEASAPGYGTWTREVVLGPSGVKDLHIKLSRKSRFAAAGRSLILPGWGQHYNESPGKGNAVLVAQAASLVAVYAFWERYQGRVDDFDEVAKLYQESRDIEAIPVLRAELERRDERADDAYDSVRTAMIVAGAVYGYAFLDALLSGPREIGSPLSGGASLDRTDGSRLGWAATIDGPATRFGLRLNF